MLSQIQINQSGEILASDSIILTSSERVKEIKNVNEYYLVYRDSTRKFRKKIYQGTNSSVWEYIIMMTVRKEKLI